jgi:hypothetical protein
MDSALHFLYMHYLDFHLKKNILPSKFLRRFFGGASFSRYLLVEIILYENQDGICFS